MFTVTLSLKRSFLSGFIDWSNDQHVHFGCLPGSFVWENPDGDQVELCESDVWNLHQHIADHQPAIRHRVSTCCFYHAGAEAGFYDELLSECASFMARIMTTQSVPWDEVAQCGGRRCRLDLPHVLDVSDERRVILCPMPDDRCRASVWCNDVNVGAVHKFVAYDDKGYGRVSFKAIGQLNMPICESLAELIQEMTDGMHDVPLVNNLVT